MSGNTEIWVIVAFAILILLIAIPGMCGKKPRQSKPKPQQVEKSAENNEHFVNEPFTAVQEADKTDYISGTDPMASYENVLRPRGSTKDFENLVYDSTTGIIQTGSDFMLNENIISPPWVPPAWGPDLKGPSSKGEIDPLDYQNDPRLLYNRCSLSCCSPQYPTPFKSDTNPFVCDKNGNSKYLSSSYVCMDNVGTSGCLCMSESQVKGFETGHFDSYVDSQKLE
jgi:hypothetical protein